RTSLTDVRARVFPLLGTPAHTLFTPRLLGTADSGDTVEGPVTAPTTTPATETPATDAEPTLDTANGATEPDVSEEKPTSDNADPPADDAEPGSGELAAEPGPLPFTPAEGTHEPPSRSRHRGPARASLLVIVSVVLFLVTAAGGFLTARLVGGQPLLPPQQDQSPAPDGSTEPTFDLVPREGDAANLEGVTGG